MFTDENDSIKALAFANNPDANIVKLRLRLRLRLKLSDSGSVTMTKSLG